MYGIMMLQRKVAGERMSDKSLRNEMEPNAKSELYIAPSVIDEVSEPFGNSVHQTRSGL
jgi:NADH-quinone oxidoreductase subunit B